MLLTTLAVAEITLKLKMVPKLEIINYPHPTLRFKSKPIKRVDAELKQIVGEMFDLMYAAKGIGLAANQVDLPIRLFIVNLAGERGEGEELVFINPVLRSPKGSDEADEGCLSLPEVYGPVKRPKEIKVNAYTLQGEEITADLSGMMARVVQHEFDHLDGVMFPDRMSDTARMNIADELEEFETVFQSRRELEQIPNDEQIFSRLQEWEQKYC